MEFFKQHFKRINKKVIIITVFFIIIGGFLIGISYAKAAWETPTSQPPDSNIFAPLDVSPNRQAKEGNLLLDPLYNPYGLAPTVNYPLEVRGPNDVYINNFEVLPEGNLIVDLDTLYVDGTNKQVGIGTLAPTSGTKLDISGGSFNIGQSGNGVTGIGLNVSSTATEEVIYGLSTGVNKASVLGAGQRIEFGTGGSIATADNSWFAKAIAIDSQYMYTVGAADGGSGWYIEKRSLTTGALDTNFGDDCSTLPCARTYDGVVLSNNSYYAKDIAIDSQYMYVVGRTNTGASSVWRIEKRSLVTGALDTTFGYDCNGGPTFCTATNDGILLGEYYGGGSSEATTIDIDNNYMYVAGWHGSNNSGRIEKHYLSDGALDLSFATNGVLYGAQFGYNISQYDDIKVDPTTGHIYIAGATYSPVVSRIEKRLISDGSLDTSFGDDCTSGTCISNSTGYVLSYSASSGINALSIDSQFIYVVGNDSSLNWRIEKRRLSDGKLCTDANKCSGVGFGYDSGGAPTGTGVSFGDNSSNLAYGIDIDNNFMYVVGADSTSSNWWVEKRFLSDGSLDSPFGTNGTIQITNGFRAYDVAVDSAGNIYIAGRSDSSDRLIEKRNAGSGGYSSYTNSIGVYGNNISSGNGIYAVSDSASAVVGSTAKDYSAIGNKVAGIYASAKGLGAWAGYFQQRLFGSSEIVGSKFLPNRLQNSQIPYTAGWKSKSVNDSELIDVSIMTFDGQYIWAIGGAWGEETVMQINPDTMEIIDKIVLGPNGEHSFTDIVDGGGYIWVAHDHNTPGDYQSAVTRIDPSNNSYITFPIYPPSYDNNKNTYAEKLLFDDQTAGVPYIWVLNRLDYGAKHSITQMKMDGTIVITFSIDALANGGNKCSRLAMYGTTNQCTDQLDNNMNSTIDNGLCTYVATDLATCTTAGGTWVDGCNDKTFSNATDCTAGGAIWATTCSNNACPTQNDCNLCSGTGTWTAGVCSDANCTTQATCEGTVTCGGTWATGDAQCIAGAPLGSCDNGINTTWGQCITAGANWTWNTSATDERIVDAYLGGPSGMTFDGAGNIWLSFSGAPSGGANGYGGEGYAKFAAADPVIPASQYVYCSGPETRPSDIAFDSINNQMWLPYAVGYSNNNIYDNRGIAKVNTTTGQVSEFLWHYFGNGYNPENEIKYFPGTPGGPSIWIKRWDILHKLNPNSNAVEHDYNITTWDMGLWDFDFDTRDVNNPVILQLTGASGVILKHTMDNPPGYQTTSSLIKGSQVESMVFDGTNIWAANEGSTIISKYSAQGGMKIADYDIGVDPELMIFDGQAIWISYYNAGSKFKRININSGIIDEYDITVAGINTSYSQDIIYDGQNVWLAKSFNTTKQLIKIDLSSCSSVTKICTTGSIYNLSDNPSRLLFDGQNILVFYNDKNNFSKFSTNPITLEADITISEISNSLSVPNGYQRISSAEFDGSYIWVGAYNVDGEGNSIYKINPKGKNDTDSFVGACSNDNSISCNLNSDCGGNTCNAVVADKYPVFHMSGSCSVSGNSCTKDSDCGGTETCNNMYANVSTLTFDGTNMWATHQGYGNHNDVGNECNDNLDNDGNGLCDADGASGYAGCSGKPDPSCLLSTDSPEMSGGSGLYDSNRVLTRIIAATGEIVESVPVRETNAYYDVNDAVFDGQNIWLGGRDFDNNSLVSFYSGSGSGLTNLDSSVTLYGSLPINSQSGAFSIGGSANFSNKLIVVNDLVVRGNKWGGVLDIVKSFGTSCDNGNFAKGIDNNNKMVNCRPL